MAEEPSKYKYVKLDIKPGVFPVGKGKGAIAVMAKKTIRETDDKEFAAILVKSGYKSELGFSQNKINSVVELPADITAEQLTAIFADIKTKIAALKN